jgi:hypothetical protein
MSFDKSFDNISKDLLEKIKDITSEKKSLYEKTVEVTEVDTSYLDRNSVESTGQLDELSDDTLRNYRKAAQAVVDTKKKGRPSAADVATKAKRTAGISRANEIMGDRSNKRQQKYQDDTNEVKNHMYFMAPNILMAHGYNSAGNTPNSQMFFKVHPEHGLVTHFKLHNPKADNYYMGEFGSSVKGWSTGDSHKHEEGDTYFIKKKDVSERKKDAELLLRKKINDYEAEQKNRALNESFDPEEVEAVLNEAQGSSNRLEKMGKKNSDFDYKKFDNKRYDKKSFDRSKRQMKDDDFREELELEESSDKLGDHTLVATRGSEDGNRYELHHKDKNSAVLIRTHKDGRPFKSSYEKHDVMWRGHPLGGKKEINHWMYNTDDKLAKFVNKGDLKEAQCSANRVEKMGKKSSDSEYKKFDNKRYDKKSFDRSKRTMKDDDFREEIELDEISLNAHVKYLKAADKDTSGKDRSKFVNKSVNKLNAYRDKQLEDSKKRDLEPIKHELKVHDLSRMDHGRAYDETQTNDDIEDGHVLKVKGGTAILMRAWPTMVSGKSKHLHSLADGHSWETIDGGKYKKSYELAKRTMKDDDFREEVEELDEVSKNTLASYISKAARKISTTSHSIGKSGYSNDRAKDVNKRISGIDLAGRKMSSKPTRMDD